MIIKIYNFIAVSIFTIFCIIALLSGGSLMISVLGWWLIPYVIVMGSLAISIVHHIEFRDRKMPYHG